MSVLQTNCSLKQVLITSSTNINILNNMLNNHDFDTSCNHEIFLGNHEIWHTYLSCNHEIFLGNTLIKSQNN